MMSMKGNPHAFIKHPRSIRQASFVHVGRNALDGGCRPIYDGEGEGHSPRKPHETDKHARCMLRAFREH